MLPGGRFACFRLPKSHLASSRRYLAKGVLKFKNAFWAFYMAFSEVKTPFVGRLLVGAF